MNYSRFLYFLCFVIVLVRGIPVPQEPAPEPAPAAPAPPAVDENSDISSLVTNGILYLIKNNLCSSLSGDLANTCSQISESIITSISENLINIIRTSINAASGNSLSVACAVIPSEIFKNLSSTTIDAITRELGKTGNVDTEKVNNIANSVLTVIANSVEKLLCAGKSTNDFGNAVINGIGGLANSIIKGVNNINGGIKLGFKKEGAAPENSIDRDIANGFNEIQEALRNYYQPAPVEVETPNYNNF